MNMRKNAATKGLSSALTKLANSIRAIRRNNPLRNNLMKLTATNRNNVNRAIQNYIMAVNKANYKNMEAQNALRRVQNGVIPESAAVVPVNDAANANKKVAEALTNIREAGAQPPPLPPKPFGPNTAGKFLNSLGNNPSANNLKKVRYIANENVVTNQVRSKARAILLKALLDSYNGKNNRWYANQNLNSLQSQLNSATRNLTLNKNTFNRLNIIRGRIKNAKQGRPANQRPVSQNPQGN
jgi:hypothetical protein